MIAPVQTEVFELPPVNRNEVLRYAGVKGTAPEVDILLDAALAEASSVLSGKVCWTESPLSIERDTLDLGFAQTSSISLSKNLSGCDRIVIFGATLGLTFDRLIVRYGHSSPAKAVMLQAIGTERIEALCDMFCEKIRTEALARGLHSRPRFSPGYGDLPLHLQHDIFRILDCPRKIGLTLNGSLLMSPSKSVTAIVGLGPCAGTDHPTGCRQCSNINCLYRRTS